MIYSEVITGSLLTEIKELNKEFYGNAVLEWYIDPKVSDAKCIYYRNTEGKIKGYALVTCISEPYYNALVNGDSIDKINIDYDLYVKQSDYWYLNSIVVAKENRQEGIGTQIMEELMKIPFKHLCAFTVSEGGKALLSKYLNVVCQISATCFILEKQEK